MSSTNPLLALYRQTVLDHSRAPRNFRRPAAPDRHAEGHNPLCGDKISVYLALDGEAIRDAAFEATGCAISLASASMMTEAVAGLGTDDAAAAVAAMDALLAGDSEAPPAGYDGLAALAGVRDYPSRIKCAALPWRTLEAALARSADTITTEHGGKQ